MLPCEREYLQDHLKYFRGREKAYAIEGTMFKTRTLPPRTIDEANIFWSRRQAGLTWLVEILFSYAPHNPKLRQSLAPGYGGDGGGGGGGGNLAAMDSVLMAANLYDRLCERWDKEGTAAEHLGFRDLQKWLATCWCLATKSEGTDVFAPIEMKYLCDGACTLKELLDAERQALAVFKGCLGLYPNPAEYVRYFSCEFTLSPDHLAVCNYLLAMTSIMVFTALDKLPSHQASACLYLVVTNFVTTDINSTKKKEAPAKPSSKDKKESDPEEGKSKTWTREMARFTGYEAEDLVSLANDISHVIQMGPLHFGSRGRGHPHNILVESFSVADPLAMEAHQLVMSVLERSKKRRAQEEEEEEKVTDEQTPKKQQKVCVKGGVRKRSPVDITNLVLSN